MKNGAKESIVKISARAFQRVFDCKTRRRYSRERAPRSLGENYSILFIRILIGTCSAIRFDTAENEPYEVCRHRWASASAQRKLGSELLMSA